MKNVLMHVRASVRRSCGKGCNGHMLAAGCASIFVRWMDVLR